MEILFEAAALRMVLVFGHLLALLIATAGVCFADYSLFAGRRIDAGLLGTASRLVIAALSVLWLTGLGIVWIDTGFDTAELVTRTKLLANLTVGLALTLNGVALHHLAFPRLVTPQRNVQRAALVPTLLGAVSTSSWLFAMFVAASHSMASVLSYRDYLTLYASALTVGTAIAMVWVRPRLVEQMRQGVSVARERSRSEPHPLPVHSIQPN